MKVNPTAIPDVLIIEPNVFRDQRGFFVETFNQRAFQSATGLSVGFVQDNHSRSIRGVIRGLHFQAPSAQGKLVRAVRGSVQDVAVDLRPNSPTQGQYVSILLSEDDHLSIWIPPGFAHGFQALTATADVLYKTTQHYAPLDEHCLAWDDPSLSIDWQLSVAPLTSAKDKLGLSLVAAIAVVSQAAA